MNLRETTLGFVCGVVLAVTGAFASDDPTKISYDLVEVSPSVFMAFHDNGSNIACVVGADGLVFFDAGLSTRTAKLFRRNMEAQFELRTKALVLTHAHLDHVLGMGAFADVPVYAASAGRSRWEHLTSLEWDERTIAGYASVFPSLPDEIPTAQLRLPTEWFDDELILGSGDDRLIVRRTGGHTVDSSSVVVGAERIVIAGDLVQARRRPYFGEPDTDFRAWIETLRRWEELEVGAVCPGHGPVIDRAELHEIRSWFESMSAAVAKLKCEGVPLEGIVSSPELPPGYWPDRDTVPRWWAYSIKRLYDAV